MTTENPKTEAYTGDGLEVSLNPQTPELNKALAKFQQKHHAAGKDGTANYGAYTTLAGGLAASQPATQFGLSHTQTFNYQILPQATSATTTDQWKVMPVLVTTLRHESGEQVESHFPFPELAPNRGNIMQAHGSAITYARRYALLAIYGLAGDDDDADTLTPREEMQKHEPSTEAKTEPVKTDLKAVFLTRLKGPDCATKADKDKLIELAVQRHEEGKLSKDDLTEIKLAA
jgi:hypothetical protein